MLDIILCASTNLIRMYVIYRFVITFLGKCEETGRKKEILFFAAFYITNTLLFLQYHTVWINVLSNLLGIGAIIWLHSKSWKTIFFVTGSIYVINMGCDVVGTALFVNYKDGVVHSQVYAAITVFLIFICEIITERIITNRENAEKIRNFAFIVVPILSVALVCFLTYSNMCTNVGVAIVSIILLIINLYMFYLYNLMLHSIFKEYEAETLKQKIQVYSNQMELILQNEKIVRSLKHDMRHHLYGLKCLSNEGKTNELNEYIERMEQEIQNPNEIVSSGNFEIDGVLNYLLRIAREELIDVDAKIILPENMKHSFDINVLLGNLVENAIEAAKQTEEKILSLNLNFNKGVLKIVVKNSFVSTSLISEEQKDGNIKYVTTKKDKQEHGIGLQSVRKIVDKYNGAMEIERENEMFCVKVVMYLNFT